LVLVLDTGNSSVAFGVYDTDGRLVFNSKLSAVKTKLCDEYAVMLSSILAMNRIEAAMIDGVIISSVVPPLTGVIDEAVKKITGITPMHVGPGLRTGLNIKIDHHTQLGADIVANTAAAMELTEVPFIVIDMGSATTITAVNRKSELCGVIIIPGLRGALDSLSESAAELPYIALEAPTRFLAKNTADSMKCGSIYGAAFAIDGFIERIRNTEFGLEEGEKLTVIATGGLASCVIPHCRSEYGIRLVPTLTLDGLYRLYLKNRPEPRHR